MFDPKAEWMPDRPNDVHLSKTDDKSAKSILPKPLQKSGNPAHLTSRQGRGGAARASLQDNAQEAI